MPAISMLCGLVLIIIGALGYFLPETKSLTAWIPAGIGLLLILFGLIARKEHMLKHMMHASALVALLAVGATASAIPSAISALQGGEVDNAPAAYAKTATSVVCIVFVLLAVRSFIAARRAKNASA